ncbi:MAG: hypothetical protein OEW97_01450 [Gammaproteobacteria bacterium]|nr:hypothetical protein [Gammaproteobacteria bacterium]
MSEEIYTNQVDLWRWKMMRKMAEFVNQPSDYNMAELKAMVENYKTYNDIKAYIPGQNYN